jgi:ABC-2 type transport system ATP-binding protein
MAMIHDIVRVTKLTKRFGNFPAVHGISFSVREGEIVGLLGPNGAGKTTTLSMMLGVIAPSSGDIRIFGKNFATHREEILKDMNYSSAYVKSPWRMTVWEHVYVFALMYEVVNPRQKTDEMLSTFHLTDLKNTLGGDLSSGNIARLNLAKAFVNQPKLVLLDEPTSSVDPDIADRIRQFIKLSREKYQTTILLTSHNMAEIEELCDRVIFMDHGKIVAVDTPEGLAKKIKKTRVRLMMRDGQKRTVEYCTNHHLTCQTNERYVTIDINEQQVASLLTDLSKIGADYTQISIDKPTLEDFFIGKARHETA